MQRRSKQLEKFTLPHLPFKSVFLVIGALLLFSGVPVFGENDPAVPTESMLNGLDTVWVLLGAFLVFFMQAGFGMVEAGFIRAKNACNILTKNFLDYCIASIMFFLVGYAFMFGEGNRFIGLSAFGLTSNGSCPDNLPVWAFWLFQAAFCGAAATIVAGAMAVVFLLINPRITR